MLLEKWIPDRKYIAGGIAGVLTFAWTSIVNEVFELKIDYSTALEITIAAIALVVYLVPPSTKDILKRIDDDIKNIIKEKAGD